MAPQALHLKGHGGVPLVVHDYGPSELPPMLVLHGNGFCGQGYEPMFRLMMHKYRVIAVDLRGHGASVPLPAGAPLTWTSFGQDVVDIVRQLSLTSCHVLGHSLGGGTALRAEELQPGLFSAMFLFEPIAPPPDFLDPWQQHVGSMEQVALKRRRRFDSREAAAASFGSKPPLSSFDPACVRAYVDYALRDCAAEGAVELCCEPETEAGVYKSSTDSTTYDNLHRVKCPILVAAGGLNGDEGPAMIAPAIVGKLQNARLQQFPPLGHFGPTQDPRGIAAAALAFFGSLPPPRDTQARTKSRL